MKTWLHFQLKQNMENGIGSTSPSLMCSVRLPYIHIRPYISIYDWCVLSNPCIGILHIVVYKGYPCHYEERHEARRGLAVPCPMMGLLSGLVSSPCSLLKSPSRAVLQWVCPRSERPGSARSWNRFFLPLWFVCLHLSMRCRVRRRSERAGEVSSTRHL